ncbi:unnamed protein product [Rotaria sp. Silwood1]|nr:unnamed protein product [Rotaria sp. Silwood1]CAF3858112.1 unnamed protein product [Rotaria sp. Silwood1]CAF3885354.1 unnamed protein product [Rotaria sp. Silwood1]CAF4870402.1 unnamed protein product [Rotaria sp. Silwood1]CAF4907916.1 unnamed protein product [Rotaria sp. Silwood1]
MFQTRIFSTILFIIVQYFIFVHSQCPSNVLIEPCLCIENNSSTNNEMVLYPTLTDMIPIRQKSIVCENIKNSSIDLRSIFIKLSTILATNNQSYNLTNFNDFLLHNTEINHLPENIFGNITFSYIILYHNTLLNSIDINAFNNTRNYVEVFRTLNTSLSDSKTLFTIINEFKNLRLLSMENDKLKSIPDNAFNHTELRYIWFGAHYKQTSQPIDHIGKYPFYNVPNLDALRIFSPVLTKIGKYSLAINRRSTLIDDDDLNNMLYIEIAGSMLNASSFEPTSLTRFRNRAVFLRLYNTSIDYLDENIFQPFLETHPASLLGVQDSNISRTCDSRSLWIKDEYCTNINSRENRVYGTACCSL